MSSGGCAFVLASMCLVACQSAPSSLTDHGLAAEGVSCNPLDSEWDCLYPYPTNFYLSPDPSTPSGQTVSVPIAALPVQNINLNTPADKPQPINFLATHPADGFAVNPQLGVLIPGGVNTNAPGIVSNLTPLDQLGGSVLNTSPVLIVDAETGELIVNFAEIDPRPPSPSLQALIIRPLVRLQNSHRYIVALQNLQHTDGSAVTAPDGFERVRDQVSSGSSAIIQRATAYYNAHIFPMLEKIGVKRSNLVLAWDLTTESEQSSTQDMVDMRAQLLAALDQTPPPVTISSVEVNPAGFDGGVGLEIHGSFQVPNYMKKDSSGMLAPGTLLNRGPDGGVEQLGTWTANITAIVPASVTDAPAGASPARVIQYGHGFFGTADELVNQPYPADFANETGTVLVATDWLGMSTVDAAQVFANIIGNTGTAFDFVDRVHQGMADFIALNYAIRSTLADAAYTNAQGQVTYPFHVGGMTDTPAIYDTSTLYYYGISQGCILGNTYLSLAPAIQQGVCGVGGASFGLMMSRASPFTPFLQQIDQAQEANDSFAAAYPTQAAQFQQTAVSGSTKVEMLSQTTLDRIDPITYLIHELQNPYPEEVAKTVAYQNGIGDAEVPNIATHLLIRSLGIPQMEPVARELYDIPDTTSPVKGSVLTEWDFEPEIVPDDQLAEPAVDNPVHTSVRAQPAAIQQINAFLQPSGTIQQFCPAPNPCHGVAIADGSGSE